MEYSVSLNKTVNGLLRTKFFVEYYGKRFKSDTTPFLKQLRREEKFLARVYGSENEWRILYVHMCE